MCAFLVPYCNTYKLNGHGLVDMYLVLLKTELLLLLLLSKIVLSQARPFRLLTPPETLLFLSLMIECLSGSNMILRGMQYAK